MLKFSNKGAVMYDDINFDNTTESATGNGKHFDKYSNVLVYVIPTQFLKHHLNLQVLKQTAILMLQVYMIVKQPCNFPYNLYILQSPRSQLSGYSLRT